MMTRMFGRSSVALSQTSFFSMYRGWDRGEEFGLGVEGGEGGRKDMFLLGELKAWMRREDLHGTVSIFTIKDI
jgi:hypothetical protein